MVFNKLDLLGQPARILRNEEGMAVAVYVSAVTGEGIALLLEAVRERLAVALFDEEVILDANRGRLRAALYEQGAVCAEEWQPDGSSRLHIRMPLSDWRRLNR
jgi:GTP-binding protein HflX